MFDELVTSAHGASGAEKVGAWALVENASCARRLSAMVEVLDALQAADGSVDREQWYLDNWGAAAVKIAAVQQITAGAASHQLLVGVALRDRLPGVRQLFSDGVLTYRVVDAIVSRTKMIKDADAVRAVDSALATAVRDWEPMSAEKLTAAIDSWVIKFDPYAVRRSQNRARGRSIDIDVEDASGLASLFGSLFVHDAEAVDRRLDALARTVCDDDPRTHDQRRADALGALACGADQLVCQCGTSDCAVAAEGGRPARMSVIHVVAHEETLSADDEATAAQDLGLDGDSPPLFDKPLTEMTLAEAAHDPDPGEQAATKPGAMMGSLVLSGALVRRIALGAIVKRIFHPGSSPPEPRYTPSVALADFVRCRDLTCRFPGCKVPADVCDLDHTIPYPYGPTQASNLKCLCRKHHLFKTFWGGAGGLVDEQSPDGTVTWAAPGGQTLTTRPGSRLLFPSLCRPTAPVVVVGGPAPANPIGLAMPKRRRTRAKDRAYRIDAERRLNGDPVADVESATSG